MADENETDGGSVKRFLYVNRKAPYGTIYALESLEVVLIGAAFEQDVSLAFLGDGVYQLVKGEDTKALEVKNFSPTYRALEDYDVTKIYVDDEALKARGLSEADLVIPVEVVSAQRMAEIMEAQDVVLSF
jgi:tRNA 2-thiouridine synthesizing protein C